MQLQPKILKKEIKKWRKILAIDPQWIINFEIRNRVEDMSSGNEDALACIVVDLSYFVANLEFNASLINEDDDLNSIILHELLHIIIEPLACSSACGLGKKYEEMNSILCESTIERLLPGYLFLYNKAFVKKKKKPTNN